MSQSDNPHTVKASSVVSVSEFRDHFISLEDHIRLVQAEIEELQKLTSKLLDVGVAISSEIDLYALLTRIIEEAKGLLKAEKGTLYLVDREYNQLYFHVTDAEILKEIRIEIDDKSIAGYVAQTSSPLNLPDVYEINPELPFKFNKNIDKQTNYRTRSMLTVPMRNHKGEVTGVVQLINKTMDGLVHEFSERDERILSSLASQAAVAIENAQLYKEIADLFESFVKYSASAIDERDPATAGHSRRVALYAVETARAMNCFTEEQIRELEYAAWLHDVGKIGVRERILIKKDKLYPNEIETIRERFDSIMLSAEVKYLKDKEKLFLRKSKPSCFKTLKEKFDVKTAETRSDLEFILRINVPGYLNPQDDQRLKLIAKKTFTDVSGAKRRHLRQDEVKELEVTRGNLTSEEREMMNAHVTSTYKILSQIPFSRNLKQVPFISATHHERLDGSGYPLGLHENDLPLQSKILSLVDVFDALTAQDRSYKPAIPVDRSVKILEEEVGRGLLDKVVFQIFCDNKIYELANNQDLPVKKSAKTKPADKSNKTAQLIKSPQTASDKSQKNSAPAASSKTAPAKKLQKASAV